MVRKLVPSVPWPPIDGLATIREAITLARGLCPESGPLARFPFPSWFVCKAMPYRSGSSGSSSLRGRSSGGSSIGRLSGPGGSTGWFGVSGWGSPGMLGCLGGLGPSMSFFNPGVIGGKRSEYAGGSRNARSVEKYHHRPLPIPSRRSSTRSRIEGSSFSGLFTLVEIGHIFIGPEGKGTSRSRGSGSRGDSQRS